jgi:hypothetical protein
VLLELGYLGVYGVLDVCKRGWIYQRRLILRDQDLSFYIWKVGHEKETAWKVH